MTDPSVSLRSRRPSQLAPGVEIDVTPVMNMFIILIPFLVSMAVFTHLATHAFTLPADDGAGVARTADAMPLTVAVTVDRLVVAQGDHTLAELPRLAANGYDQVELLAVLAAERARRPEIHAVVVAVDDPVVCADLVGCLDQCRAAGFDEVGVAAGTGLDGRVAEVSR